MSIERAPSTAVPRRQRGSAYLTTLLALIVLTIVGLSLALITQTEMRIGANERTVQRVFYAADSGIESSTARALVSADYAAGLLTMEDLNTAAALDLEHEVATSPFFPILQGPCNLCEINNAGEYGSQNFSLVNHAVSSLAVRRTGADATPLAEKTLSIMVEVQPWQSPAEALLPLTDPDQLAKIKF